MSPPPRASSLDDLPDWLLSRGVPHFTTADAHELSSAAPASVRPGLARLAQRNRIFSPARGLYVPIPPQYRQWGAVPASWFIDAMMTHLERDYYVGLLSAAEVYGAAHQRPQVFQVMVDRPVRDRAFGRVQVHFVTRSDLDGLPVERANTETGTMQVSSAELTLFDLASRLHEAGGLDNLATICSELVNGQRVSDPSLAALAPRFAAAPARRIGWLLENEASMGAPALHRVLPHTREPSLMDPYGPDEGPVDPRWRLRINFEPESESP